MPAKNTVKIYLENGYYHVYNRGAGKSEIFIDNQDYRVFLHYLEKYLDPNSEYTLASKIKLLAYCLMPNHFHLFVQQKSKEGITKFMRALSTSYAMYFNKRYERSGTLFQGIYKAALVETEPYFLHLSRYIHLNPSGSEIGWRNYPYSSYSLYKKGSKNHGWVDTTPILDFFQAGNKNKPIFNNKHFSYKAFVEDFTLDSRESLGELAID